MLSVWLTAPVLGALIGWFTNWVALKMLFHPRRPLQMGPLKIQGLIPRRQSQMAEQIADVVSRDLLTPDDLGQLIRDHGGEERLMEWVKDLAASRADALLAQFPMITMFISPEQIQGLKEKMVEGVDPRSLVDSVASEVARDADLKGLLERKIGAFDLDKLEEMVQSVASKEFRFIEILGAVLGALIGVLQAILATWA